MTRTADGAAEPWNLELWNCGTLNFGTLEPWNRGTLNFGTLELWNPGTLSAVLCKGGCELGRNGLCVAHFDVSPFHHVDQLAVLEDRD
jgi:hypothetical protein